MANELKHKAVGTVLTQVEFEATDSHAFADQAAGDILYASSTTQLRRLGKGADNTILTLSSGVPAWTATPTLTTVDAGTDFTVGTTVITDDVITFTPTTNDTVTLTAATNGAFSLVTVDTAAAAANIQITADGTVDIDSTGALTLDSGAAINIEPASGSVILLDGVLTVDAGVVAPVATAHDTAGTAISISAGDTTAGTTNNIAGGSLTIQGGQGKGSGAGGDIIFQTADAGSSGSSINALATALTISDDLSATFAGATQFNGTVTIGVNDTGLDFKAFGATSGKYMLWDQSEDDLVLTAGVALQLGDAGEKIEGDGTDLSITSSGNIRIDTGGTISIGRAANADRVLFMEYDFGEQDANKYGMHIRPVASETDGTTDKFLVGVYAQPYIGGSSFDVTNDENWTDAVGVRCLMTEPVTDAGASGTITGVAGLYIANGSLSGSATATWTNQYGIYMETLTDGTTNDIGIEMGNNSILNVGAAGNDWTTNAFTLAGGSANQKMLVETTGSSADSEIQVKIPASGSATATISFYQGSGNGSANNMSYYIGYDGSGYLKCRSRDTDGSSTDADIWRIPDGQLSVDANTTWDTNVFDSYDDVGLIRSSISPTAEAYDFGQGALKRGRDVLIEIGVLRKYEDGFIGYNDQRMAALLAGGIYQTRSKVDELEQRLQALGG
jgi:hypothetical protein